MGRLVVDTKIGEVKGGKRKEKNSLPIEYRRQREAKMCVWGGHNKILNLFNFLSNVHPQRGA